MLPLPAFAQLGACLSLALSLPLLVSPSQAATVTSQVDSATAQPWDYVIVGGGLTGLVVAKRLADAGSNASVLVIEAGNDDRSDARVVDLDAYTQAFDTDLDWAFETTPQDLLGGATRTLRAGKTLGGSTSINGAAWNRGHRSQYDALANLTGNARLAFGPFQARMNMAEDFAPPDQAQQALGADWLDSAHGFGGPLEITFTQIRSPSSSSRRSPGGSRRAATSSSSSSRLQRRMYSGPQQAAFAASIQGALGVETIRDQCSGDNNGAAYTPNSIRRDGTRSSAATSYLAKASDNLTVLTGWRGATIVWDGSTAGGGGGGGDVRATGVRIQQRQGGPMQTVAARREVILATGAINTPALLERSGVGAASVLRSLNVPTVVDLPGVGLNLQEQTMNTMGARAAQLDLSGGGPSNMIALPNVYQLFPNATELRGYVERSVDGWAASMVAQGHAVNSAGLLQQWRLATSTIFDARAPVCELSFDTGYPAGSYGIDTWCLLPFSRGSSHATSPDAFVAPQTDPNYFALPIDMDMQVAALRANRQIYQYEPLRSLLAGGETQPGVAHIPDGANHGLYRRWRSWILGTDGTGGFSSVSHQLGTCSMMAREAGGVVDAQFKVYGTANVRVVDAAALPSQLSAHLSSSLYGWAELAAQAIRGQ